MTTPLDPAASIIRKLGGASETARICGVHRSQPGRWMRPLDNKGTGGFIPARHQPVILRHARAQGIDLEPGEFVEASPAGARNANADNPGAPLAILPQPQEARR